MTAPQYKSNTRTDMQKVMTMRPLVVEIVLDWGRIKAEMISFNSINDHFLHDDCGNTSLDVSERSKSA